MKSTELVYFHRNKMGLFIADAGIASIAVTLYLMKHEIEVKQYFNQDLISAEDIEEDLLSEYMDTVCFIVTQENKDFVYGIGDYFSKNEEDYELIFLWAEDKDIEIPFGVTILAQEVREKLPAILGRSDTDPNCDLCISKIYRDKMIPVNMSGSLGILLNAACTMFDVTLVNSPEDVLEELNFIAKYIGYHSQIVLYTDNMKDYPYVTDLMDKISHCNCKQELLIYDAAKQPEEKQMNDRAIKNGIRSFYTGLYYDKIEMAYTKHIGCGQNQLSERLFSALSVHNAANNGIYVFGKNADRQLEAVKEMALKSGYLFSNFISYKELEVQNLYETKINGTDAGNYRVVTYQEAKGLEDENTFLSLESEESLKEFLKDIRTYKKAGLVKYNRMWKYDLVDQCRWINFRSCSLNKLYRFTVDKELVYPCISSDVSLGTVNELHFKLVQNACVHMESEQVDRKCDECSRKLNCPKCSMLPAFLSKERYCELMRSDLEFEKYFLNMMAIRTFFEYCSIKKLKDITPDMILFVTEEHEVSVHVQGVTASRLNDDVMLGKVREQDIYILFNWRVRQALLVNNTMFMIAELLFDGQEDDQIIRYMAETFEAEKEAVKRNVQECLSLLAEKEYMNGKC